MARLYCLPYAGATASVYRPWQAIAAQGLSVVGVDQPGRGTRRREPRVSDYRDVVRAMADHVVADLRAAGPVPYATFGHSFGAMLSLAVAAEVAGAIGRPPKRAVLSAALPPRLQPPGDETTALTDAELLAKIRDDGGTAPELLASDAMAAYLVRLMREDYAVRCQFHRDIGLRVDFPLTLIAAADDAYVTPEQMWRWAEHTTSSVTRVEIAGGHFAAVHNSAPTVAAAADGLTATVH